MIKNEYCNNYVHLEKIFQIIEKHKLNLNLEFDLRH